MIITYGKRLEDAQEKQEEYLFVGVSPQGRYGFNYWYIDETKKTKARSFVWVKMGRHDTEQIVYVDSVRYCNEENAPYPIDRAKRVLRQTTEQEASEAASLWGEISVNHI